MSAGDRNMDMQITRTTGVRPRGSFIEASDGTALFYRDWGAGRPVPFLSGWGLCSDAWAYQMAPLSESGLRCIACDRRGHGQSGDAGGGYDFDTLADDVAAVIQALDLRQVTLVGYSMGGGEVVRYLSRHGTGRVARIVFVGSTTPCMRQAADNPSGRPAAAFESFRRDCLLRDYPRWLDENARPFVMPDTPQAMIDWVTALMLRPSMQALVACNRALEQADFRGEMAAIRLPALVVHGDRDVSAPLELCGRPTARLIPDARLEVYEGAPHGLPLTHIERLNRDLLEFVGRG